MSVELAFIYTAVAIVAISVTTGVACYFVGKKAGREEAEREKQ